MIILCLFSLELLNRDFSYPCWSVVAVVAMLATKLTYAVCVITLLYLHESGRILLNMDAEKFVLRSPLVTGLSVCLLLVKLAMWTVL